MAGHLPGLSETPGVAVLMGAAAVAVLKLPLSCTVITVILTSRAGLGVSPLIIVAVVISYLTIESLAALRNGNGGSVPAPAPVAGAPAPQQLREASQNPRQPARTASRSRRLSRDIQREAAVDERPQTTSRAGRVSTRMTHSQPMDTECVITALVAYHGAGRAVVASALGQEVFGMSVRDGVDCVRHRPPEGHERDPDVELVILLAGRCAESELTTLVSHALETWPGERDVDIWLETIRDLESGTLIYCPDSDGRWPENSASWRLPGRWLGGRCL